MNRIKNRAIGVMLGLLFTGGHFLFGQKSISLEEAIGLAQQQSLDAFKAQNQFLADYWNYQSYLSQQKPHLSWYLNPVSYDRRFVSRYDYSNNIDVYRLQQTISSYTYLNLSQNITSTGGNVYLKSNLYRLQNIGEQNTTSWSTTPFVVGFEQPLFGYNEYKWQKKISPLKYEKAKQEYIQSVQDLNIKVCELYFNLLLTKKQMDITSRNIETSKKLYEIGQRRFEIASIKQEDMLDLELSKFNAEIECAQAEKSYQKAAFNLRSILGWEEDKVIEPIIPGIDTILQIDVKSAVELTLTLNPNVLELKQRIIESESTLDQAKKNEKFSATLSASYGLNQSAGNLPDSYKEPLGQQTVNMNITIPLVDWGDRRGQREMAQKEKEVTEIEVKQAMIDFEQEVTLKVIDFNLQAKVVKNAKLADRLAQQSFELTQKRFVLGNTDVLQLTSSMKAMQNASEKYITSLAAYWQYFYEVQQLTLYDFIHQKSLSANFDELIKK